MLVSHGLLFFSIQTIQNHRDLDHVCFSALRLLKMEFLFLDIWFSVLSSPKRSDITDDVWFSVLGSQEEKSPLISGLLPSTLKNGRLQPDVWFSSRPFRNQESKSSCLVFCSRLSKVDESEACSVCLLSSLKSFSGIFINWPKSTLMFWVESSNHLAHDTCLFFCSRLSIH